MYAALRQSTHTDSPGCHGRNESNWKVVRANHVLWPLLPRGLCMKVTPPMQTTRSSSWLINYDHFTISHQLNRYSWSSFLINTWVYSWSNLMFTDFFRCFRIILILVLTKFQPYMATKKGIPTQYLEHTQDLLEIHIEKRWLSIFYFVITYSKCIPSFLRHLKRSLLLSIISRSMLHSFSLFY